MTDQNKTTLKGIIPLPPREVSSTPYIVQPGDTVERITGRFTHPAKWPGLVGANVHRKALADAEGQKYAVFAELKVGEPLYIPASWVAPPAAGQVGGCQTYGMDQFRGIGEPKHGQVGLEVSAVSQVDPITQYIQTGWPIILAGIQTQTGNPAWTLPVGPNGQAYTPADVARVVAGYIPYIPKMPGTLPPGVSLPAEPLPTADPTTWLPLLTSLARSAAELLAATQVQGGGMLQTVPWDQIPWKSFPWLIFKSFENCWAFFQNSNQKVGGMAPTFKAGLAPEVNNTPNFLGEDWQQGWPSIPWNEINWPTLDPTILNNEKVKACLKSPGAAERLKQMAQYPDCFKGAGPDVFAKYLCPKADGTYEPLSTCGGTPQLPCPDGTHLDPTTQKCLPNVPTPAANCAAGYHPFPAPNLPQGVVCCQDGSVYDITTGMCLLPGGGKTPPAGIQEEAKSGLGTPEKLAIGVATVGVLGLLYALWSKPTPRSKV